MNRKYWIIALVAVLVAACGDEAPKSVEVEVTATQTPAPPYIGKNIEFYRGNGNAFDAMRAWCTTYVESVRTRAQSLECGTVGHVHRTGGPRARKQKIGALNKNGHNGQLPSIPDARNKSTQ